MKLTVYHTSGQRIERPDVAHSRQYLDFGPGFYVTTIREQAVRYGDKFRRKGQPAWLNTYELAFDDTAVRLLRFESYDAAWLRFVTDCRRGVVPEGADVVVGGVANDQVFATIDLYFDGLIEEEQALRRLAFEKPNMQMCISKQRLLDECCRFVKAEEL